MAIWGPPGIQSVVGLLGVAKAGTTFLAVPEDLLAEDVAPLMSKCGARILLAAGVAPPDADLLGVSEVVGLTGVAWTNGPGQCPSSPPVVPAPCASERAFMYFAPTTGAALRSTGGICRRSRLLPAPADLPLACLSAGELAAITVDRGTLGAVLAAHSQQHPITSGDVFCSAGGSAFVFEALQALTVGASLVVVPGGSSGSGSGQYNVLDVCADQGVTVVSLPDAEWVSHVGRLSKSACSLQQHQPDRCLARPDLCLAECRRRRRHGQETGRSCQRYGSCCATAVQSPSSRQLQGLCWCTALGQKSCPGPAWPARWGQAFPACWHLCRECRLLCWHSSSRRPAPCAWQPPELWASLLWAGRWPSTSSWAMPWPAHALCPTASAVRQARCCC